MDIEIRGRKILLIGNGFDLAHGLPTSYSYFLDFCDKVSRIFTYLMHVDEKVYEKSALNIWEVDDSIKAKLLEWYKRRNENPDKLAVEIYNNIKENIWIHYFLNGKNSNLLSLSHSSRYSSIPRTKLQVFTLLVISALPWI